MTLITFFQGKKTYLVGAVMIILGCLQGDQNLILQGIATITLRAGIAKMGQ